MELCQKSVLENGIRVVTEVVPSLESVTLGIWIVTGSRDEAVSENGLSHFIEHLLFKGTKQRNPFQITREIESVGGSINAFTGKEYTCLHAKVLHKDIVLATDIVADILANSVFDSQEIERERMVILQEIKMIEDTPDEYIHDLFHRSFWGDHPLGYPISGMEENVLSFQQADIVTFFRENYTSDKVVIAAAGQLDHQQLVRAVETRLGHLHPGPAFTKRKEAQGAKVRMNLKYRDLEQIHFCMGTRGIPYSHRRRFAGYTMNTMLGGNMSSRLFQEIREKRGLTYSIYSFLNAYTDTGLFGVYAGTTKDEVQEVVALIIQELKDLREGRIRAEDLSAAKEYVKGGIILSLESSEGRMSRLAKNEIYFGRQLPLETVLKELEEVSEYDVYDVAQEMLDSSTLCLTLLGTIKEGELSWRGLEL